MLKLPFHRNNCLFLLYIPPYLPPLLYLSQRRLPPSLYLSLSLSSKLYLTIQMFTEQILCNLFLPFITITQQFLLIVQQLFVSFRGKFKVGSFDNCIDWACLLTLNNCNKRKDCQNSYINNIASRHEKRKPNFSLAKTYKSTINTLGHINIISRSPPSPILSLLGINRNSLGGTRRLTQFTGNTTLISRGVTS